MWIQKEPLKFIKDYLNRLEDELKKHGSAYQLSAIQRTWLGFCLMGILLTSTICWAV